MNGDECCQDEDRLSKKGLPRKAKHDQSYTGNSSQFQTVWDPQKDEMFLKVWEKHASGLQAVINNSNVLKAMELDLRNQGIKITITDIKYKIRSFTRTFR